MHSEERHDFDISSNIIGGIKLGNMGWARQVARVGQKRNSYNILVGKPEGKRKTGNSRLRPIWEEDIKWF
jgi:hypothetical protein